MKCKEVQIDQQKMLLVTIQSSACSFLGLRPPQVKLKLSLQHPTPLIRAF